MPRGLLEPPLTPQKPRESITMDFIIGLPKSEGYESIIVVMYMFSLSTTLIVAPIDCTVGETMRLFLKHVVKY